MPFHRKPSCRCNRNQHAVGAEYAQKVKRKRIIGSLCDVFYTKAGNESKAADDIKNIL